MGNIDKVWATLGGHPVVWYSLTRLAVLASAVVLVVRPDRVAHASDQLTGIIDPLTIVAGGDQRQDSVRLGLQALPSVDVIAVHDAARPFASLRLLQHGLESLHGCEGAIPVLPVSDTIKTVDGQGTVVGSVDRSMLRAAQTPQVFRARELRAAHEAAAGARNVFTDDAGLLERAGRRVRTFPGETANFKITTAHELDMARALIEHGSLV